MICPECKNLLRFPEEVYGNVSRYVRNVVSVTLCCNKPLRVMPRVVYTVEPLPEWHGRKEDDWGRPIK